MAARKQANKEENTYLSGGNDLYLLSLQKYILPSVIKYYEETYSVENVTVDELANEALKVKLPLESANMVTPTKEAVRKPRRIDPINGCQFILERSRLRRGEACGEKRDIGSHFCKHCQDKTTFADKAQIYADKLGVPFEDVVGPNYQPRETKKPKVPAKRGPKAKSNVPVSKPGYKGRGRPKAKDSEEEYDEDDNIEADEDHEIQSETIEGLDNILYEPKTNIVFYMPKDENEKPVAFGQWTENGKISRLTEPLRITAKQYDMSIGKYEDYDLGKYSVNYVEPNKKVKQESENEDEDDENSEEEVKANGHVELVKKSEPERPKPEERFNAIPNRRTIKRK